MNKAFIDRVKLHEGYRSKAYQDTEGVWTIGYGTNLQELEIDVELAERWLLRKLEEAELYARRFYEWKYLDTEARQNVFIEMIYNMGPDRVSKFKNTLAAMRLQDWKLVATEMLDSKWAKQVGQRARTLADIMIKGTD